MSNNFDDDEKTPKPDPPSAQRPTEIDLVRQEQIRLGHRVGLLETRLAALEEQVPEGTHRIVRQWRYLRRYIAAWLREDTGATELERLGRQWRRFRKYLAVWLKED